MTPPRRCRPDYCHCGAEPGWSTWPMHWRPDIAPPAPWTWLDNRPDPTATDDAGAPRRAA